MRDPGGRDQIEDSSPATDQWARWLLRDRFGGSADRRRKTMDFLIPIRDHVIEAAQIAPGDTVLDVGCGDGLLGFAALDRCGSSGHVIFADISSDLLSECERLARFARVADRCSFVRSPLPDLGAVASNSIDVVVFRSVLIYVKDKRAAFHNMVRVMHAGGRLSSFEPINSFSRQEPAGWLWGFSEGYSPTVLKNSSPRTAVMVVANVSKGLR